jgi:hypothetical protein
MARPLRIQFEGAVYHVTSRGNARQGIFLGDDNPSDFLAPLEKLFEQIESRRDRHRLIHEAARAHHYKPQEVANHLGLHLTTISVIAKREASQTQE